MADNVTISQGSTNPKTVASDEVTDATLGTVQVQYVKLMDGALDSTTKISPATSANQATEITALNQIHSDLIAPLPAGTNVIGGVTQSGAPWSVTGSGTAGTAASGVLTVQGITSMTPVQVSQATAANLNATVTQGGTWSVTATQSTASSLKAQVTGDGATGTTAGTASAGSLLMGGVFNTALPTVTNGQQIGLQVSNNGSLFVTGSGPVSNNTAQAGSMLAGAVFNTTPPTLTTGQQAAIQVTSRGMLLSNIASATGTSVTVNTAADALANGVGLTTSGQNFFYNGTNWDRARSATADGAATTGIGAGATMVWNGTSFDRLTKAGAPFRLVTSAASTNATNVKASAGTVYSVTAFNTVATTRYLKFFNTSGVPTPGSVNPVDIIALPQGQTNVQFGATGEYFATGIGIAIVANVADLDNTAIASGDIVALIGQVFMMPYLDNRNDCSHAYILYQDEQFVVFWDRPSIESVVTAAEFVSTMTVTAEDGSTTEIPRFDTTGPDVEPIPAEVTARRAFLATYAANNGGHL